MELQKRKQGVSLMLLFVCIKTALAQEKISNCSQEIYDEAPQCPPSKTYVVNTDRETCKVTLTSTNCSIEEGDLGKHDKIAELGRGSRLSILGPSCKRETGPIVVQQISNPSPNCYNYMVPVCEAGKYELNIQTLGGSDATKRNRCYDIKINGQVVSRVLYFNLLDSETCPRTEVLIKLKVDMNRKELQNTEMQKIPLHNNEFSLSLCFYQCGNATGTLQVGAVSMNNDGNESAGVCKIKGPDSDCKHYHGDISSICWSHGCQFYLNGKQRCARGSRSCETKSYANCICSHEFCDHLASDYCTPEPSMFENKLTCRRANTFYVYHPKQHCYSETDSGDCTATTIHAVNAWGYAFTDQRGIRYIGFPDDRVSDPNHIKRPITKPACTDILEIKHEDTKTIYNSMMSTQKYESMFEHKRCFSYPIPICQSGEYMLTVKLLENFYEKTYRCTEVRINNIPIMLHLDIWLLAGKKKCAPADAAVLFLADGGDDNDPKSDRTLHLKGHDEPIPVKEGYMELQFCFGYNCPDNSPLVSAFSLERLMNDTKPCKFT